MIKIYYFSATGNSLWSAKKIAGGIDEKSELINIGIEAQKEKISIEADAVVLLFPAYAYGPPLIIRDFLRRAEIKTPYFAAFVTFGTSPGGALAEISRILKRKKIRASWFGRIPAVENYIAIFGPQKAATIERRVEMQRKASEEAVRVIVERKTNRVFGFRPFSAFVSLLFSIGVKVFYNWYRVDAVCNGCGICEKVCPVSAVTLREGRPVFSKKCEHCQACLSWCPREAISFGRIKPGIPRYHHPEIGLNDISR